MGIKPVSGFPVETPLIDKPKHILPDQNGRINQYNPDFDDDMMYACAFFSNIYAVEELASNINGSEFRFTVDQIKSMSQALRESGALANGNTPYYRNFPNGENAYGQILKTAIYEAGIRDQVQGLNYITNATPEQLAEADYWHVRGTVNVQQYGTGLPIPSAHAGVRDTRYSGFHSQLQNNQGMLVADPWNNGTHRDWIDQETRFDGIFFDY